MAANGGTAKGDGDVAAPPNNELDAGAGGDIGGDIGDGWEVAGNGVAAGDENIIVNSPGPVLAGGAGGGTGAGAGVGTGVGANGANGTGVGVGGAAANGGGTIGVKSPDVAVDGAGVGVGATGVIGPGADAAGADAALNIIVNSPGTCGAAGGTTGGTTSGTTGAATTGAATTGAATTGAGASAPNICVNDPAGGAADEGTGGAIGVGAGSTGTIGSAASAPNICVNDPPDAAAGAASGAAAGAGIGGNGGGPTGATGGATGAITGATTGAGGVAISIVAGRRKPTHSTNEPIAGTNSVTMANPDVNVAVSSTRFLSAPDNRPSSVRSCSTSSGPALSAICTSTTRPESSSCALWVRIPSSTAMHFSRRYRALKSSLIAP